MTYHQRMSLMELFQNEIAANGKLMSDQIGINLRHGCCQGSDEQVALLSKYCRFFTIAHIPENRKFMSSLAFDLSDHIRPAESFLARDRTIVHMSDVIYAAPKSMKDKTGGTWYTIEYAVSQSVVCWIIQPDGMWVMA